MCADENVSSARKIFFVPKEVSQFPVCFRTVENGCETVEIVEDGQLVSKSVDGVIYLD